MISALIRVTVLAAILFGVGLLAGMEVSGTPVQIAGVVALTLGFSLVVALWSVGYSLRTRSVKAGAGLQIPILILMFLVPVYTTRELLANWVQAIADYNPVTAFIEASRGLMVGEPVSVAGFPVRPVAGLSVVFTLWVVGGLRSAEAAGGLGGDRAVEQAPSYRGPRRRG